MWITQYAMATQHRLFRNRTKYASTPKSEPSKKTMKGKDIAMTLCCSNVSVAVGGAPVSNLFMPCVYTYNVAPTHMTE